MLVEMLKNQPVIVEVSACVPPASSGGLVSKPQHTPAAGILVGQAGAVNEFSHSLKFLSMGVVVLPCANVKVMTLLAN